MAAAGIGLLRCMWPASKHAHHSARFHFYRYYRCRSTAGGREPGKGVLIGAYEIESAVLEAAGVEQTGLTSQEEETAFRAAIRRVVFKADVGRIEIEFLAGVRIADGFVPEVLGKV